MGSSNGLVDAEPALEGMDEHAENGEGEGAEPGVKRLLSPSDVVEIMLSFCARLLPVRLLALRAGFLVLGVLSEASTASTKLFRRGTRTLSYLLKRLFAILRPELDREKVPLAFGA